MWRRVELLGLVQVDRAYVGRKSMAYYGYAPPPDVHAGSWGDDRAVDDLCLPTASPLPWDTAGSSVGWHDV